MNWFAKKISSSQMSSKDIAAILYARAVERVRNPLFYQDYAIEDAPLGRFELLALHLFILLRCLKERGGVDATQVSQDMCNLFAADMDHSLRDIRVSEMKADRQYKKFIEGFYGRLVNYDTAIESLSQGVGAGNEGLTKLIEVILKNVYSEDSSNRNNAEGLAAYIVDQLEVLRRKASEQSLLDIEFNMQG